MTMTAGTLLAEELAWLPDTERHECVRELLAHLMAGDGPDVPRPLDQGSKRVRPQ
ncbi:hypothetical protein [Nonomuraea wenchangensis]|uniref:Uncharacterized protein n=1 Tax=Nonomuraea wenchangensis TaxID=568860 RepID=A0A1I0EGT2_9ACTN|nr:hypothetical protein [Nonomuraea wenchangensis]SET44507.1 hypothetical protein SAMN05421811_10350 [Nonomuraea wenchangensis]